MKRIAIMGPFPQSHMGGSDTKTRSVYRALLNSGLISSIRTFDTSDWKKDFFKLPVWIIYELCRCDAMIFITGTQNFLRILPYVLMINDWTKKKIHFIPIGDCKPEYFDEGDVKRASQIQGIYVQTEKIADNLATLRLPNVYVMHNFKYLETFCIEDYPCDLPLKFCYFSRITESKGIFETIEIFAKINQNQTLCTLDVYGLIEDTAKERFLELIKKHKKFVQYKGVVEAEKASNYIKDYYMMVFPTKDVGEGFPGVILDAFAAGVPLLVSRFSSFYAILHDGRDCISFSFENYDEMYSQMCYVLTNTDKICLMRKNCHNEYYKYDPSHEINMITNNL